MKKLLLIVSCLLSSYLNGHGIAIGTLIKTADGLRPIEQVIVKDQVYCWPFETMSVLRPVTHIFQRQLMHLMHIKVNNEVLKVAPSQQLYCANYQEWIPAAQLQVGDTLLNEAQEPVAIQALDLVHEKTECLVLAVADYHNFYIGNSCVLAHNAFAVLIPVLTWTFGEGLAWIGLERLITIVGGAFIVAGATKFANSYNASNHHSQAMYFAQDSQAAHNYSFPNPNGSYQPDLDDEDDINTDNVAVASEAAAKKNKKQLSLNQIDQKIKKGQAPKTIRRVCSGQCGTNKLQDHLHFLDDGVDKGRAVNVDGTWSHQSKKVESGLQYLQGAERRFMKLIGWALPEGYKK